MKIIVPHVVQLLPKGILSGRNSKAVFVSKHNSEANLEAVRSRTETIEPLRLPNWLFLIEGYQRYSCLENMYIDGFTQELEIKTEDPIIPPFTSEAASAASIERTTAALAILTMDYLDTIADSQVELLEKGTLENMFEQGLNTIAKAFGVSSKSLRKEFLKLSWHDREILAQQLLALAEKRRQLINKSNSQSEIKLGEILNRNSHSNLFIMSGIEHATVFAPEGDRRVLL